MPEEYCSYSGFTFLASPRGELFLSMGTTMVTFDPAFDVHHNEEIANLTDGEKLLTRTNR